MSSPPDRPAPTIELQFPQISLQLPMAMNLSADRDPPDFDSRSDYTHSSLADDGFDIISHASAVPSDDEGSISQDLSSSAASLPHRSFLTYEESDEDDDDHALRSPSPHAAAAASAEDLDDVDGTLIGTTARMGRSTDTQGTAIACSSLLNVASSSVIDSDAAARTMQSCCTADQYFESDDPLRVLYCGPDDFVMRDVREKIAQALAVSPRSRHASDSSSHSSSRYSIITLSNFDDHKSTPEVTLIPSHGLELVFDRWPDEVDCCVEDTARMKFRVYDLIIDCMGPQCLSGLIRMASEECQVPCIRIFRDDPKMPGSLEDSQHAARAYDSFFDLQSFLDLDAHVMNRHITYLVKEAPKQTGRNSGLVERVQTWSGTMQQNLKHYRQTFNDVFLPVPRTRRSVFRLLTLHLVTALLLTGGAVLLNLYLVSTNQDVLKWSDALSRSSSSPQVHTVAKAPRNALFVEVPMAGTMEIPSQSFPSGLEPESPNINFTLAKKVLKPHETSLIRVHRGNDSQVLLQVAEGLLGRKFGPNLMISAQVNRRGVRTDLRQLNQTIFELRVNETVPYASVYLRVISEWQNTVIGDQVFLLPSSSGKALMDLSTWQASLSHMLPNNTEIKRSLRKDLILAHESAQQLGKGLLRLGMDSTALMIYSANKSTSALRRSRKELAITSGQLRTSLKNMMSRQKTSIRKFGKDLRESKKAVHEAILRDVNGIKRCAQEAAHVARSRAELLKGSLKSDAARKSKHISKAKDRARRIYRRVNKSRSRG